MLLLVMLFAILKIVLPLVCLLCLRYTEKRSIPNKLVKNIENRKEHQSEYEKGLKNETEKINLKWHRSSILHNLSINLVSIYL